MSYDKRRLRVLKDIWCSMIMTGLPKKWIIMGGMVQGISVFIFFYCVVWSYRLWAFTARCLHFCASKAVDF